MSVREIVLTLPVPPSVNGLFKNIPGRGRAKTKRYGTWQTEAGWHINLQKPGTVVGGYQLAIVLPQTLRGDLDNYVKPLSDLLTVHGVIEDDRFCTKLTVEKGNVPLAVVTLRAAS